MKKLKKNIIQAVEYLQQNPTVSLTKIAELFATDRHLISKYQQINFDEYKELLFEN